MKVEVNVVCTTEWVYPTIFITVYSQQKTSRRLKAHLDDKASTQRAVQGAVLPYWHFRGRPKCKLGNWFLHYDNASAYQATKTILFMKLVGLTFSMPYSAGLWFLPVPENLRPTCLEKCHEDEDGAIKAKNPACQAGNQEDFQEYVKKLIHRAK